jgi:hypothetical protein
MIVIICKVMGGFLFAMCIYYLMLLYKNNRNKL